MATAAKKKAPGTAIAKWDEELAKQAAIAAGMEANAGGGQFFGTKGGILTWQDAPMPDNQMAVIILDHVLENTYYEGKYDPNNPQAPICFAFGRDDSKLTPHKIVWDSKNQQCGASGLCKGCDMNEWGSAEKGRGKACKNSRRIAMIPAGSFKNGRFELIEDEDHYASATVGYMRLPVTSVTGFAGFVKQVAETLQRPPHGIITKVKAVPHPKNQFQVIFEPLQEVPDEFMGIIMQRNKETAAIIEFPYQPFEEQEAPPARGSRAAKQPAKKAGNRRY